MKGIRIIASGIGILIFQWAFIQGLPLSIHGNPYMYLWFLLILPFQMSTPLQYFLAFLIGSLMDSFEQSGGAHTIACLTLIVLKPIVENALLGFRKPEEDEGLAALNLAPFISTAAILVSIHHLMLFTFENYGFDHYEQVVIRTFFSTLLTLLLLFILHALIGKRHAKK